MTHKQHLAELKTLIAEATDLSIVYTYFFDHLGEDNAFLGNGRRDNPESLKSLLESIGEAMFKQPVKATHYIAIRANDEPAFLHGTCAMGGHFITFLYFEDITTGLAAAVSLQNPGKTNFIRFTGQKVPPPPSKN